jgi:hypothetical protein
MSVSVVMSMHKLGLVKKAKNMSIYWRFCFCLLGLITSCVAETSSRLATCTSVPGRCSNENEDLALILNDIKESLENKPTCENLCMPTTDDDIALAIRDFSVHSDSEEGEVAWKFLRGIADSPTFVSKYWHQRPLLIRAADTGSWAAGCFTLERDLRYVN